MLSYKVPKILSNIIQRSRIYEPLKREKKDEIFQTLYFFPPDVLNEWATAYYGRAIKTTTASFERTCCHHQKRREG